MSSLNTTSFEPSYDNCKNVSALCPVEATVYGDYFTLEPCALFAALFGACAVWQLVVVFWRRTWTFSAFLFVGTFIEFIGYVNRAQMSAPNGNPWNFDAFKNQLLTLILGPTFIAAAIALTFKWMVIRLGPQYSLFDPKWYPWTFVGSDVLSIAIQLAGGIVSGIAADGSGDTLLKAGDALLIAGTAFQTVNMSFCGGLMLFFWWRRSRAQRDMGSNEDEIEQLEPQRRTFGISDFKLFLWAIIPAYIAIVVRCIYRIPEMAEGWGSSSMQNETLFLILDGAMILIATIALTIVHPGFFFTDLCKPKRSLFKHSAPDNEHGLETPMAPLTYPAINESGSPYVVDGTETDNARYK